MGGQKCCHLHMAGGCLTTLPHPPTPRQRPTSSLPPSLLLHPVLPACLLCWAIYPTPPPRHPAGDVVFMSSFSLGRCPRLWKDPLRYDPSRFAPEAVSQDADGASSRDSV